MVLVGRLKCDFIILVIYFNETFLFPLTKQSQDKPNIVRFLVVIQGPDTTNSIVSIVLLASFMKLSIA